MFLVNRKYYNCFSYKQKSYLLDRGFKIVHVKEHYKTKKRFWVFKMTTDLSIALSEWSKNKV